MTLTLELRPEEAAALSAKATARGVDVATLLHDLVAHETRTENGEGVGVLPEGAAEKARVAALLQTWRRAEGLPTLGDGATHTPVAELFAQWEAEDAQLTPEEVEAERRFWEDYSRDRDNRGVEI
jgi:hypothetical protein